MYILIYICTLGLYSVNVFAQIIESDYSTPRTSLASLLIGYGDQKKLFIGSQMESDSWFYGSSFGLEYINNSKPLYPVSISFGKFLDQNVFPCAIGSTFSVGIDFNNRIAHDKKYDLLYSIASSVNVISTIYDLFPSILAYISVGLGYRIVENERFYLFGSPKLRESFFFNFEFSLGYYKKYSP